MWLCSEHQKQDRITILSDDASAETVTSHEIASGTDLMVKDITESKESKAVDQALEAKPVNEKQSARTSTEQKQASSATKKQPSVSSTAAMPLVSTTATVKNSLPSSAGSHRNSPAVDAMENAEMESSNSGIFNFKNNFMF